MAAIEDDGGTKTATSGALSYIILCKPLATCATCGSSLLRESQPKSRHNINASVLNAFSIFYRMTRLHIISETSNWLYFVSYNYYVNKQTLQSQAEGMWPSAIASSRCLTKCWNGRDCLEPLIATMDDRSRLKDTLHLSHCITSQYLCPLFCASMVAKRLYAMVVTGPIPPEAEKPEV